MFKTALLKLLGELGDFLAVLFKSGIQKQLKVLLPIAMKAVKEVASDITLTSGDAKFNAAFDIIGKELGAQQATIGRSLVNLAIELAYQKWMDSAPTK
jgi:hypothetical protein